MQRKNENRTPQSDGVTSAVSTGKIYTQSGIVGLAN